MPWPITYYDRQPDNYKIGDMWLAPEWANSPFLSGYYLEHIEKRRPPLMICLPSVHDPRGDLFLIDRYAVGDVKKKGWRITIKGKLVSGVQPQITLAPSINCVGSYHGYIRAGHITDDVEGRTYPQGSDAPHPDKQHIITDD